MGKKSSEEGWWHFLVLCQQAKSLKRLDELFNLFLTIEERESIATRCVIIRELLKQEKTQREMAKECKVSIAKITRGSNSLKIIGNDLRQLLKKVMC